MQWRRWRWRHSLQFISMYRSHGFCDAACLPLIERRHECQSSISQFGRYRRHLANSIPELCYRRRTRSDGHSFALTPEAVQGRVIIIIILNKFLFRSFGYSKRISFRSRTSEGKLFQWRASVVITLTALKETWLHSSSKWIPIFRSLPIFFYSYYFLFYFYYYNFQCHKIISV